MESRKDVEVRVLCFLSAAFDYFIWGPIIVVVIEKCYNIDVICCDMDMAGISESRGIGRIT